MHFQFAAGDVLLRSFGRLDVLEREIGSGEILNVHPFAHFLVAGAFAGVEFGEIEVAGGGFDFEALRIDFDISLEVFGDRSEIVAGAGMHLRFELGLIGIDYEIPRVQGGRCGDRGEEGEVADVGFHRGILPESDEASLNRK